jgi:hypothetical protein
MSPNRGQENINTASIMQKDDLSEKDLTDRVWQYGVKGQAPLARYMLLRPQGRFGGYAGKAEKSWSFIDGRLRFQDQYGRCHALFSVCLIDAQGRLQLESKGRTEQGDEISFVLQEIAPPYRICPAAEGVDPIGGKGGKRRRNLLVLRANENSLHQQWPRDIAPDERNWDLCVSFYGKTENFAAEDFAEFRVLQNEPSLRKFTALYKLLHEGSFLLDYDYIALPDDDLMISWRGWNEVFNVMREYDLKLAQPAMAPNGFANHLITQWNKHFILRFTSFVEIMTPIFSRDSLRVCLPTFCDVRSGFGLDLVWPKIIGAPMSGIGVIDQVFVTHTRPMATDYNLQEAIFEGKAVETLYGAAPSYVELGGICRI